MLIKNKFKVFFRLSINCSRIICATAQLQCSFLHRQQDMSIEFQKTLSDKVVQMIVNNDVMPAGYTC